MIGLDTNVLVRHLAQDDPVQSPIATRLIEHELTTERPGYVSAVTLTEVAWVLRSHYRLSTRELADILETILRIDTFVVQNHDEAFAAVAALRSGKAMFEDAFIGAIGAWAGCSATMTFDRKAARLDEFKLL